MSTFNAQLLGQTEKAANAILDRLLAKPGLTEPQWVTLTLTVKSRGTLDRDQLAEQVADALKLAVSEAAALVSSLAAADLIQVPDDRAPVMVTAAGEQLYGETRAATAEITHRLWGDLPADDLATAGRVLRIVLDRANSELAAGQVDGDVTATGVNPDVP